MIALLIIVGVPLALSLLFVALQDNYIKKGGKSKSLFEDL